MRRQAAPGPLALKCRYAGAAALAAAVFAIDSFTTLGSAVAVLYVLVLIIVGDTASERAILASAAACIALTLFSFVYVHGFAPHLEVVLRLLFSLSAIIATAFIIRARHADRLTVESQAELLDVTSDAIFLTNAAGRVVYWNRGAENLYGWSFDEAWGRDPHDLLGTRFPQPKDEITSALGKAGAWEGEITQMARDGRIIHVFSRWRRRQNGEAAGTVLQTNTNITERKAADEALRQSEQRFRTIFETLAVAIWEHDLRPVKVALDGLRAGGVTDVGAHLAENPEFVASLRGMVRITDVNGTALKLMGVPSKEEFFTSLDEFFTDADQSFKNFLLALDTQAPTYESEATIQTRQGDFLRVIVAFNFPPDGTLDRVQANVLNITERVKVQEALQRTRNQLDQALRAATIGEVSASIAHEINQPLAAIVTHAAAAQRWMDRDPPDLEEVRASLNEAAAAAHRASEVVRRVRTLMAKVEPEKVSLAVNPIVEEAMHFVRNELTVHSVTLTSVLDAADVTIQGDRILLQQVMINLMTNAIQAMHAVSAGERHLSVRAFQVDGRVCIDVVDSGPGFSEQSAQKAFEPFFTTKTNGMGLGLAMCRTIITAHEGEISLGRPPEGSGGRVSIWLPVATGE